MLYLCTGTNATKKITMKKLEITLYKFEELTQEAKNFAIEKEQNNNDPFSLDMFKENCIEQIIEAGFKGNEKVQYSLSYSQGDGLSFECDYFEKMNDIFVQVLGVGKQKTIDLLINNISFSLKGNEGRYCYASKKDITLELDSYNVKSPINIELVIDKVREKIQFLYRDLCNKLEIDGYNEIEFQESYEYISENLISNEYDFLESGEIYF